MGGANPKQCPIIVSCMFWHVIKECNNGWLTASTKNLHVTALKWRSFKESGVNNFGKSEKLHWIYMYTANYPSSAVNILVKMHESEYLGISELAETWGYEK